MVDVVDYRDVVVGQAARTELRDRGLNYRVVHVLVVDSGGRLLIQNIASSRAKEFQRGSSVAGHVMAGESYDMAARREFEEELGIPATQMRQLGTTWLDEADRRKFIGVFVAHANGPFHPDPGEIDSLEFMPLSEVRRLLRAGGMSFSSTFRRVFQYAESLDAFHGAAE